MKIALIGYEANIPHRVGSNQYAFELLKALYNLEDQNQYTVFLPSVPLPDLPKPRSNWQYKVVGPKKLWNVFGLPLALFLQKPRPDIVFNPGHYCPLFCPVPLVVSIMDLGYLKFPQHFPKATYWKLKFWTAFSIKRAKSLLTISQSTKNDIIKHYQIDPGLITVAYPGYDQGKFKKQIGRGKIEEIKKKYRIKGDYLLFLSTLKPSKNIEGLLEAFTLLKDEKLSLVVTGRKGWMFETIFVKVKDLGLTKKVVFTDFVPDQDVPAILAGAKVFVLPSFWEGFGIPVVEAMAVGTPVVVSNVGSLPEVVGSSGIIINPEKPKDIARGIKEALAKKEELVAKGFKQIAQYNWEKCAQQALEVLLKTGLKK
jgi:glycosyltransferase involved in cell wall biosynthesis